MKNVFTLMAQRATSLIGSPYAFGFAVILIVSWAACGPLFGWSAEHSLLINTITTIATFLAVFLLQNAQNEDTQEIKEKLDKIIARFETRADELTDTLEEVEELLRQEETEDEEPSSATS